MPEDVQKIARCAADEAIESLLLNGVHLSEEKLEAIAIAVSEAIASQLK